jgi:uncharacterized repeat protein (TIGR03803 family)
LPESVAGEIERRSTGNERVKSKVEPRRWRSTSRYGRLSPRGGLIEANGAFYGKTESDGASFGGTVFRITADGDLTTLHSFDCVTEGCSLMAGLGPVDVNRSEKFEAILPILWLMAGAAGDLELLGGSGKHHFPKGCPFCVLLREDHFEEFPAKRKERPDITHVFLVTDSVECTTVFRARQDDRTTMRCGHRARHLALTSLARVLTWQRQANDPARARHTALQFAGARSAAGGRASARAGSPTPTHADETARYTTSMLVSAKKEPSRGWMSRLFLPIQPNPPCYARSRSKNASCSMTGCTCTDPAHHSRRRAR